MTKWILRAESGQFIGVERSRLVLVDAAADAVTFTSEAQAVDVAARFVARVLGVQCTAEERT